MLSTNAIFAAFPLAEQFDASNVVLVPVAGTPLNYLVGACNVTSAMVQKLDSGEISIDTYSLELAANNKVGLSDRPSTDGGLTPSPSRHDATMDEFVKISARSVQNALTVARTAVAPRITELMELVSMRLQTATPSDLTRVEISSDDGCNVIYNPAFQKLVSKYENAPLMLPAMNINAQDRTVEEILAMLETGVASLDADIIPWAANLNGGTLQFTWRAFFTFSDEFANMTFPDRLRIGQEFPILVFLLAKHLLESDEVLEGLNMSLKDYKATLLDYVEQAGLLLCANLKMSAISVQNGILVRSVIGTSIKVNPPVYNTWLENGGDNDILFGMAISQNRAFTVSAITENAELYRAAWKRYVATTSSTDSSRKFSFLMEQLAMCYENILRKPNADGEVAAPESIAKEMQSFNEQLRQISIRDADDLHYLCQRLVCRTSFNDTPAELILSKMDEVAKQSPGLTPREAAALATLWYISSWVGEQMTVVAS